MDQTIPDRVQFLCDHAGLKPKPFGVFCGLSPSHVGMILRRDVGTPDLDTLHAIADTCGVPRPWLVYGVGAEPTPAALERLTKKGTAFLEERRAARHDADDVAEKGAA